MGYLHVDANFPGGGVDKIQIIGDSTICFEAPLDLSPQSLWFAFRITGGQGKNLKLVQKGLEHVLGVFESRGYSPVVPVWKDGDTWVRVDEDECQYSEDPLQYSFTIKPQTDECYVAFCFPYTLKHAKDFFDSLPQELISFKLIGVTKADRPHPAWIIGYPQNPEVKELVVLTARQHAGEVSGSFAMEGFLRELTSGSQKMVQLLKSILFLVIPILDLDCVEEGCYGKDQSPVDFNRNWSYRPFHPEIQNVMTEIEILSKKYKPIWACDFHAPQPGAASYMPPSRSWPQQSPEWNRMWNLALLFEEKCQKELSFHVHDVDTEVLNWGGKQDPSLIGAYYRARWECPSDCYEFSYHRDSDLKVIGKQEWNKMGRLLAQAAAEILLEPENARKTVDLKRIPPWTITPSLNYWKTTRKTDGFSVKEDEKSLLLEPERSINNIWVTSPKVPIPKDNEPVFNLISFNPCQVDIYFSFYNEGLHITHTRQEKLLLNDRFLLYLPPVPKGSSQYSVSVIAKNLTAPLKLQHLHR